MKDQLIKLFMWGYQPHFRAQFEICMNNVMDELGVSQAGAECLLGGARIPERQNPNGVCVEAEDGKWTVGLLTSQACGISRRTSDETPCAKQ